MKALVIYESMYGNTHVVADAIAAGLSAAGEATAVSVHEARPDLVAGVDLVVVGGPTHVHGMSRTSTRKAAFEAAQKPGSELALDPDAFGDGLREWFATLERLPRFAASFDTRIHAPALVTGRASKGIARKLRGEGSELIVEPESFLVTKDNVLEPGEEVRAERWGALLATNLRRNNALSE